MRALKTLFIGFVFRRALAYCRRENHNQEVMRRFCALTLCLSLAVFAAAPIAVGDLVGMVTSALAVDRDDQRTARTLQSVHLSERLSDSTIDMLRQMGAGRETLRELRKLARKSSALPPPSEEPIGVTPEPSATEKAAMIDAMIRYASDYVGGLPDFVCTREARQFRTGLTTRSSGGLTDLVGPDGIPIMAPGEGSPADKRWGATGSYTAEAVYAGGADHYKVTQVDGKPTTESFDKFDRKVSWGEFSGAMKEVFGSGPGFEWDHWEVTGGKRSAVFTYSVDSAHSHYSICCPPAVIAHRGFVYTDPQNGTVRRIIMYAAGLTNRSPITALGNVVDYGEVTIGDRSYLLPRTSVAYTRTRTAESREEIDYRNYRKFGADTTVAFPSADQPRP
jgi:hypothetical protein